MVANVSEVIKLLFSEGVNPNTLSSGKKKNKTLSNRNTTLASVQMLLKVYINSIGA